jgi:hypothetical protein
MNFHLSYEKGNLWMNFIQIKISNTDEWLWIVQYNFQFLRMDKRYFIILISSMDDKLNYMNFHI